MYFFLELGNVSMHGYIHSQVVVTFLSFETLGFYVFVIKQIFCKKVYVTNVLKEARLGAVVAWFIKTQQNTTGVDKQRDEKG